jgi:hypothetical protein
VQVSFVKRGYGEVYLKPVGAKGFVVVDNVAVVFAFPFFAFDARVVLVDDVFKPVDYLFINVVHFHPTVSAAVVTVISE